MNKIIVIMTILFACAVFGTFYKNDKDNEAAIKELRHRGEKSPAHKYAVEKYLSCKQSGFIPPSQDSCVGQVITLSRVQGPEFEKQVIAAVIDIGLN